MVSLLFTRPLLVYPRALCFEACGVLHAALLRSAVLERSIVHCYRQSHRQKVNIVASSEDGGTDFGSQTRRFNEISLDLLARFPFTTPPCVSGSASFLSPYQALYSK